MKHPLFRGKVKERETLPHKVSKVIFSPRLAKTGKWWTWQMAVGAVIFSCSIGSRIQRPGWWHWWIFPVAWVGTYHSDHLRDQDVFWSWNRIVSFYGERSFAFSRCLYCYGSPFQLSQGVLWLPRGWRREGGSHVHWMLRHSPAWRERVWDRGWLSSPKSRKPAWMMDKPCTAPVMSSGYLGWQLLPCWARSHFHLTGGRGGYLLRALQMAQAPLFPSPSLGIPGFTTYVVIEVQVSEPSATLILQPRRGRVLAGLMIHLSSEGFWAVQK